MKSSAVPIREINLWGELRPSGRELSRTDCDRALANAANSMASDSPRQLAVAYDSPRSNIVLDTNGLFVLDVNRKEHHPDFEDIEPKLFQLPSVPILLTPKRIKFFFKQPTCPIEFGSCAKGIAVLGEGSAIIFPREETGGRAVYWHEHRRYVSFDELTLPPVWLQERIADWKRKTEHVVSTLLKIRAALHAVDQDDFQDTAIKVWGYKAALTKDHLQNLVRLIIKQRAKDRHKKRKPETCNPSTMLNTVTPQETAIENETKRRVEWAIELLTAEERFVVRKRSEGWSFESIGQELGISRYKATKFCSFALSKLKTLIEG